MNFVIVVVTIISITIIIIITFNVTIITLIIGNSMSLLKSL